MAEGVTQGLVPVPGGPGEAIRTAGVAPGGGVLADGGVIALFRGAAAAHEEAEPAKAAR